MSLKPLIIVPIIYMILHTSQIIALQKPETRDQSPAAQDFRVGRLCLDPEPDGSAIFLSKNKKEFLLIFKSNLFYMIYIPKLTDALRLAADKPTPKLINSKSQLNVTELFPGIPSGSPYKMVSFPTNESSNPFYNNILAFFQNQVLRYEIKASQNTTQFILHGKHSTAHWWMFPSFSDIKLMTIARDAGLLIVTSHSRGRSHSYSIVPENLDNPVERPVDVLNLPIARQLSLNKIRYAHQLESRETLVIMEDGDICVGAHCKSIKSLTDCDPQVSLFANSFAYALWHNTNLTLRLIMITLSSVMIVNFVLAMSFIYNQIMNIYDLT